MKIPSIYNHLKWLCSLYKSNQGEMSVGSMLFYGTSFMIMLAIPLTVVLLKTEKDSITRASSSPLNYQNPPTSSVDVVPTTAKSGERVAIHLIATNSNWTVLYFSPAFPATNMPTEANDLTIVAQGPQVATANYSSAVPGYFMAVTYQLQGNYGYFKSGDVMCSWDGSMYIYQKKDSNMISSILSRPTSGGKWDRLTTCQNSGVKQLSITQ